MRFFTQRKHFSDLTGQEILALAIASEEDDARIYRSYAARLRADYPATAAMFDGMTQIIRHVPLLGDWLMHAIYPALHIRSTGRERQLPSSVPGIIDLQQQELRYRGFIPAVLASLRGILNEDFTEELRSLHSKGVPALAIWGQEDAVIPPASAGLLAERARSVRQEDIPGAGHGLPYTHTEEVLEIIAANHRRGLA